VTYRFNLKEERGKSGLYKDTVPGNSWQGQP